MAPYTPLLRPGAYFAARDVNFFRVMAVFAILLFTGPATIYGVGWITTANVEGTVLVDNPERPPDWFCETNDGCSEPKQIERDVDAVLWDQFENFLGPAFIVYPLFLGILALLLHGGVWLVGGERGWFPTVAVTAWGLVPSVVIVAAILVGLWFTIDPVSIAPGDDVGRALEPLEQQFRAFDSYRTVGTLVESIWAGLIWRAGLREHQGLPTTEATVLAGIVAGLTAVLTLLL